MAEIKSNVILDTKITFTLNEQEARALNAIAGYGANAFINVFYEKMGKHYLQPYEAGLRSLFEMATQILPQHYENVDKARELLKGKTTL